MSIAVIYHAISLTVSVIITSFEYIVYLPDISDSIPLVLLSCNK